MDFLDFPIKLTNTKPKLFPPAAAPTTDNSASLKRPPILRAILVYYSILNPVH